MIYASNDSQIEKFCVMKLLPQSLHINKHILFRVLFPFFFLLLFFVNQDKAKGERGKKLIPAAAAAVVAVYFL